MFEKEAEEYVRKIRHDVINWDGAELGESRAILEGTRGVNYERSNL